MFWFGVLIIVLNTLITLCICITFFKKGCVLTHTRFKDIYKLIDKIIDHL